MVRLFNSSYDEIYADAPPWIRCSFTFDPENFPDPKAYLADIKERYGVKICVWSTDFLLPRLLVVSDVMSNSKPLYFAALPDLS